MGFIIKYRPFIDLLFKEKNAAPLEIFYCFPTDRCRQLLNQYRMIFRRYDTGFRLFFSELPFVDVTERLCLSFGFQSNQNDILKKYGLIKQDETDTNVYQPGLYFDNLNPSGSIKTGTSRRSVSVDTVVSAADTYHLYGQTFNVFDKASTGIPASYELNHQFDTALHQTVTVRPANGGEYVATTINSPGKKEDYISQSGPYILSANTSAPPDRRVYLDTELNNSSALGAIDIYWETSLQELIDQDRFQRYKITFNPT